MNYQIVRDHGHRVEFRVSDGDAIFDIYFECRDMELSLSAEAIAACLLFPYMATKQRLELSAIDHQLHGSIDQIQDIAGMWFPKLEKTQVTAGAKTNNSAGNGVAAFFSGGMDSFYTLEKNLPVIETLLFVHGFDVELDDAVSRSLCSELVRQAGRHYGKKTIEIETNLRQLLDVYIHWGFSHGAAFAAIAYLLHNAFAQVFIASSYTYLQIFPWGSHPLLDPLWSSQTLRIVHDGCEASRVDKARTLAKSPFAMNNLRVCWENPGSSYNCGVCEKCLRTMTNFEAVGASNYGQLFPVQLSLEKIRAIPYLKTGARIFAQENLDTLVANDIRPDLQRAWRDLLQRSDFQIRMNYKLGRHRRRWSRRWQRLSQWFRPRVELS